MGRNDRCTLSSGVIAIAALMIAAVVGWAVPVSRRQTRMRSQTELAAGTGPLLQPDLQQGTGVEAVASTNEVIGAMRGVSDAAADVHECMCPEPCERDHANE
jgi:hypothetical protein